MRADVPEPLPECPQLKMIRMEGEVYFGAVSHVGDQLRDLRAPAGSPKHLLVMAKSMNFIDLAGRRPVARRAASRGARSAATCTSTARARRCSSSGSASASWPSSAPTTSFPAKRIAIATIFDRLDRGICAHCTIRVFEECQTLPLPIDGAASEASPGSRAPASASEARPAGRNPQS